MVHTVWPPGDATSCANVTTDAASPQRHVDSRLRERFGLPVHVHWDQYRDVIDGVGQWAFYGLGIYITVVSVASAVGSLAVIGVTLR